MKTVCYKPKVGEILYRLNTSWGVRHLKEDQKSVVPCEIVHVGNKYFTTKDNAQYRAEKTFHIQDWKQKTEYSSDSFLYATMQEYLDEKEFNALEKNIRDLIYYKNTLNTLGLEQVREINKILMGALV